MIGRRTFLRTSALGIAGAVLPRHVTAQSLPPVRTITRGPKHHWFGYYDKLQFDPTDRYVLSNEVDFEHRTPTSDDVIRVGMVDTANNDRWIELGTSHAWGWQQGCMLQWVPGTASDIVWNDRESGRFVCRKLNTATRDARTIDHPIYTLSPDGSFGLSLNFARLQVLRPGYGYVGLPDPFGDELAPKDDGVFRVNLATGNAELILPLSEVANIPHQGERLQDVWHYFNHLLIAPDAQRFIVLHRWRRRDPDTGRPTGGFITRMITANLDGSNVFVLDPSGYTSHFIWRDPEHVCMWTKPEGRPAAFYLFRDRAREIEIVGEGVMPQNGHNTYLPTGTNEWILNDTYPDRDRLQHVYLYHVPTNTRHELGAFLSPREYTGEWRCDTHPRASNYARYVCIDSPHIGEGRQLHLIDIKDILRSV
jgi:hypothetical protein